MSIGHDPELHQINFDAIREQHHTLYNDYIETQEQSKIRNDEINRKFLITVEKMKLLEEELKNRKNK